MVEHHVSKPGCLVSLADSTEVISAPQNTQCCASLKTRQKNLKCVQPKEYELSSYRLSYGTTEIAPKLSPMTPPNPQVSMSPESSPWQGKGGKKFPEHLCHRVTLSEKQDTGPGERKASQDLVTALMAPLRAFTPLPRTELPLAAKGQGPHQRRGQAGRGGLICWSSQRSPM